MYTERLEALHECALKLGKATSREEIVMVILEAISSVLGFQWGGVGFVDDRRIKYARLMGLDLPEGFEIDVSGCSVTATAVRIGKSQLIHDVRCEPGYIAYNDPNGLEMLSELAVPIIVGGEVIGVINVESERLSAFVEEDKRVLELFSQHVSWALNRIELMRREKLLSERLVALHRHAASLASATSLASVCQFTLVAVSRVLGFEYFAFLVVEDGRLSVLDSLPVFFDFTTTINGKGITARAAREKRALLVNDLRNDDDYVHSYIDSLSELTVPVLVRGETVALLNAESLKLGAFSSMDQSLMETLAMHVSSAIERLKRSEEEALAQDEMLRRYLEGIGKFSTMIQHDLRAPLQAILNASYLLKNRPELGIEMFNAISKNVDYAQQILEGLDDIGSPSKLKLTLTNIIELLDESLSYVTLPDSVKIEKQYIADLPRVMSDRVRIRRVVVNLVKNAVEAMPKGGVLTIGVSIEDGYAYITVKDTGVGIPKEQMDKLFTLFNTTKPTGTGIGLAYCKQTVESHGGGIKVASKVGEGTIMRFCLPIFKNPLEEFLIKSN